MYLIYLITNSVTGKYYVGATCNLRRRLSEHKSDLRLNKSKNERLQSDYNKYGESSFKMEILEIIDDYNKVAERESYYISQYDSCDNGYNMTYGGENFGAHRASQVVLDKMSKAMMGNDYGKGKHRSFEQRKHYSETWYSSRSKEYLDKHFKCLREARRKVSEIDAINIRYRYLCSESPSEILKDYSILSIHGLSKICRNESWKHLPNTKEELHDMLINYQTKEESLEGLETR